MRDYIVNNFLPEDHQKAKEELDCFIRCTKIALKKRLLGDIDISIAYLENAKRSERVLAGLMRKHDKAWFIIKQNEADRTMAEMLVKAYD